MRSRTAIDRLIPHRNIHVREKTLWRILYEACARAEELLQLNILDLDLDLAGRSCPVKSKGAKPRTRRRGAAHHEHVPETVSWDAGTRPAAPEIDQGPHPRTSIRDPPPPQARQIPRRTRYLPPTPDRRGCPTTRPATSSTPPPPSTAPEPAGTCTNSGTQAWPTSANPA